MKTRAWIAVAVLGLAALALAQPADFEPAMPPPGMPGLDLSQEQLEKVDQLRVNHLKETMPLETDMRLKEMELGALWRAEKLSAKAIVAKVKEIAEVRTRLEVARVNHRINAYNVLTPEQQKRARQTFARGFGRRGMMRGMRQGFGHGQKGLCGRGQRARRQLRQWMIREPD